MQTNGRFWLALLVFQLAYGGVVFGIAREYYRPDVAVTAGAAAPHALPAGTSGSSDWTSRIDPQLIDSLTTGAPAASDPAEISRLADEQFAAGNYAQAAVYYERLLSFAPGNADIQNNLGLTWHYLGRSAEALDLLQQNVADNPDYQRSWLTLGFVNRQMGNTVSAREALQSAVNIDASSSVGQSAQEMLDSLQP